jgi:hypothetical protein
MAQCPTCLSQITENARFCSACGAPSALPNRTGTVSTGQIGSERSPGRNAGHWMGRHPILTVLLFVLFFGLISRFLLHEGRGPNRQGSSETPPTTQPREANLNKVPPPKFSVFKSKTDMPTSYVVPVGTTDEQLRSLLWFFREKVRAGQFSDIGIAQPTETGFGEYGYKSGMLVVFRGATCANEDYVSDAQIEKGNLGPCGYGEHDDAYYQWGVDGDPNKDDAGIRSKDGDTVQVFDYKDDWHASSEPLHGADQQVKEKWREEWEPRQRLAVQITNVLKEKGIDVDASADQIDPEQLDFRSELFKDPAFCESFLNKALPQVRSNLCSAGFRRVGISRTGDSDSRRSYTLKCK